MSIRQSEIAFTRMSLYGWRKGEVKPINSPVGASAFTMLPLLWGTYLFSEVHTSFLLMINHVQTLIVFSPLRETW